MRDEEITAIRRIRREILEECAHDVHKVAAYYRAVGKRLRLSGELHAEVAAKDTALLADSAKTK